MSKKVQQQQQEQEYRQPKSKITIVPNREEALIILKALLEKGVKAKIVSNLDMVYMAQFNENIEHIVHIKGSEDTLKVCRCCHAKKPKTSFSGRKSYCKVCVKYSTYTESQIQIEFFDLVRKDEELSKLPIFAVPNGGLRDKGTSRILKQEGVISGVWDILSLTPNKQYLGFMIETKALNGKLSDKQSDFEKMVNPIGEERYDTYIMHNPLSGYKWVKEFLCR